MIRSSPNSVIQGYFPAELSAPRFQPQSTAFQGWVSPPSASHSPYNQAAQAHQRAVRTAAPRTVQPATHPNAFPVPATQLAILGRRPGQPLSPAVQRKMEAFFQADFSDVRVRVGPEAASLGALALTHGSDIYFAPGQYQPTTPHGQQLLGHELTHVVQQRAGRVRNPFRSGIAVVHDRQLEAEADRLGQQAAVFQLRSRFPFPPATHVVQAKGNDGEPGTSSRKRGEPSGGTREQGSLPPKRSRKKPFDAAYGELHQYFGVKGEPDYHWASDKRAGGCDSSAILSPRGFTGGGSDANPNKPAAMKAARKRYGTHQVVAGHLLNADFGGKGKDSDNLTILSAKGNSNHKEFDEPLKKAGAQLKEAYRTVLADGCIEDFSTVKMGIKISVKTGRGTWGTTYPDNCIFNELICQASLEMEFPDNKLQDATKRKKYQDIIKTIKSLIAQANANKTHRTVQNPQPSPQS